jgi:Tol biopolymer transport system component/tRNA A-37 threonylcarbamoyl transferase component Bud32
MPLSPNSRLGPYEIKSALGVGGMGEVYRAHDSRLDRDVAIKILREDAAEDPERRARFEREAHAIAALNHPNVVAVYDFGIEDGQQYIVSELVEGEPLRSLLTGKRVLTRKLVDIGTQVANGLAAAHAAGFVHRDLKPENIILTAEGRAKILDFGLAHRQKPPVGVNDTITGAESTMKFVSPNSDAASLTHAGVILGTAAYMSPEQALGRETDFHSDQFSFGLILYELASGTHPFVKASPVETMAAIVREDPAPLDESVPIPLRWIVDRCLAKEPSHRYGSTRDLYQDLRNLRDHPTQSYSSAAVQVAVSVRPHRWVFPLICAACALLAASLAYMFKPAGQNIGNYRYTPLATDGYGPVWSPDGKAIAYSAQVDGVWQLFERYLSQAAPVQLTHGQQDVGPMGWSSDRAHLILWEGASTGESRTYSFVSVPTIGGDLEPVIDFDCIACDLSRDGKALATFSKAADGAYGVSVSDPFGSPLRPYTPAPFASKDLFNAPQIGFSPDGKSILLLRSGEGDKDEIWLLPYPAGSGVPRRVLERLTTLQGTPTFSWMPDNRHIVVSLATDVHSPKHLWMADIESDQLTPLTTGNAEERFPVVAPDGKSLIYSQSWDNLDVVSVSLADGEAQTLISTGRQESMAAWAANQEKLAWVTNRNGPMSIWIRQPDGSERPLLTASDFPPGTHKWFMDPSLSPNAQQIVYVRVGNDGVTRLWISSLSGGVPVRLTNAEPSAEFGGSWSPDGKRFAYLQVQGGKDSLMVANISGRATPVTLVENVLQYLPEWSPDGNWITYRDDKGWNLISPDGKRTKSLGKIETAYLAFSKDSRQLYGIKTGERAADRNYVALFSIDPATLRQRNIKNLGKDLYPASNLQPGIRFSVSPDGKSLVYCTAKNGDDLWMLQGYRQPGLWNRIENSLHLSAAK